ncbi:MAG TPA: ATP-binding protein [Gaiellaceae bacterium]|jgi:serine/threonine-protein kinase RsbW|nr:ATP-binding protein [Gaiellaceae bacterium]
MSDTVVRLRFPAKPEYLLLARLTLSGVARQLPVDDELVADLKLALTEACGNAVRHGYADGDGDVDVVFAVNDERIELTVEDRGDGIRVVDTPDVRSLVGSDQVEGGMGMSIIRAIVDDLEVDSGADGRGTVVRMVKYLTPRA